MKDDQSIDTPCDTIVISRPCFVLNQSTISRRVGLFWNSIRSHNVHSMPAYLLLGAAIGSENPKNGSAMLTKPFL